MRTVQTLLIASTVAFPAFAGVVFEVETKDIQASETQTTEIKAAGGNLKIGIAPGKPGAEESDAIYHTDPRKMVVVDHSDRSYMVLDEAAIKAIADQVSQAMSQREEALKNVPEDQRSAIEQMINSRMPPPQLERSKPELAKTGDRETHSGYPCVKYEILRGGVKVRELWVTDWNNIEGSAEIAGAFEDLSAFTRELLDSIPKFGDQQEFGDPAWEFMEEIDGFPVVTRNFGVDGSLEAESTLRSAKRATLDPAEFEPPFGYKRRSMLPQG